MDRRKAALLRESDGKRSPVSLVSRTKDVDASHPAPGFESIKPSADIRATISGSETSRSSTPVTENTWGTPSTSSWATSTHHEGECGFPRDDDAGSCRSKWSKWEDEYVNAVFPSIRTAASHDMKNDLGSFELTVLDKRSAAPREPSPTGSNDEMTARLPPSSSQVESLFRQSQLRNSISAPFAESTATSLSEDLDSDGSESGIEEGEEGEGEEDNDWSGENDNLDATVIAAVDGDLGLAAFLIPLLHKDLNSAVRSKVESWQYAAAPGPESSSSGGNRSSLPLSQEQSPTNSRKRRRRSSSGGGKRTGDGEDGEDDGGGGGPNIGDRPDPSNGPQTPLLACPFHKWNPSKYNVQHTPTDGSRKHDYFRACAGPGFKSIQRLKEHLKRKHTPVQCERCYFVFQGTDRAACINRLTEHRRGEEPCERGDPSLKEGISEAQWAALDRHNRKKNQETHKLDKWFEIWRVLFPEVPQPETPWYDGCFFGQAPSSPSRDSENFANLFLHMLNHKVHQGDISIPEGHEDLRPRLKNLVQQAFKAYVNLHGSLSKTDTSSSLTGSNNQQSLLGGSSTRPSIPMTSASQQMTATTVSTATTTQQSPQYTLSIPNPPNAPPYAMAAIPMSRQPSLQPSQYQNPMPAQFANTPFLQQEDLSNYYVPVVYPRQPWPQGVPYPGLPAHFGSPNQLQPEFYSQPEGYAPGQDGDFNGMQ